MMTTLFSKNLIIGLVSLVTISFTLSSCNQKMVECLAPPPQVLLSFIGKDTSEVFATTRIKIAYQTADNKKTYLGDLTSLTYNPSLKNIFRSTEIIGTAESLGNNTAFTVEVDGVSQGNLLLKTSQSNEPCNPWTQLTGLTYKGVTPKTVSYNVYVIPLN
jgi:hypothetical protein